MGHATTRAADLVIETLADSEGELLGRIRSLEADIASRDEIISVLLERLHEQTLAHERTQNCLRRRLEGEREVHVRPEAHAA